ncbi:hypothetical protein [Nonlabens ulvanivorans]|uniref:Uncharacterized protein n=1 Tax=Nonlabens ulvanivorans TaxID=906888 RepID=A0A084K0B9_NONUL|nr:hypothetical protein [Nonlabens ulvanivorans]KEZ94653.1 hypothetical protein IL45_00020 [Nonlabens ulvanivorans]PRX12081.1 hypothetical protein LY02_02761 [Nonlabens ulvanivorans]
MKKVIVLVIIVLSSAFAKAQISPNSLLGLPRYSTVEINSITGVELGTLVYDSDLNRVLEYTNNGWEEILVSGSVESVGVVEINAAGDYTISGLNFTPTSVTFHAYANVETTNLNSDNGTRDNETGIGNSFGSMTGFARDDNGTIVQQVIYVGGSGNSINDISRFASSIHCIGVRYGNQNGISLGLLTARVTSFTPTGFVINVDNYIDGLVVIYEAHR